MKKLICIMVVFALLFATFNTQVCPKCTHAHRSPALVLSTTTAINTASCEACKNQPNNHNLQEMAVTLEKIHDFANSADYMEGLTAISKRTIYCGDADWRGCAKLNI